MKKQKIKELVIRPAMSDDCVAMENLINTYVDMGEMLHKNVKQLFVALSHYVVAEVNQTIIGVCGLKIWPIDGAEIISSAVKFEFRRRRVGLKMNQEIIRMIRRRGFKKVFVLTKQTEFYSALGFKKISKTVLSYKTYVDCINCPKNKSNDPKKIDCINTAMQLLL